ncbi:hypothetical protein FXN61_41470 [Lentzea sp. PSKA42]|uniref:Uncharacterized protein n=1 Tax=Lentzea indica TaxID=2604800 RepID=A0ABX1FVA2_9PSEU|nr:hypothetical protein [Lentzea indica]NKE62850.1 hypothetical protein [Lentzea indica]
MTGRPGRTTAIAPTPSTGTNSQPGSASIPPAVIRPSTGPRRAPIRTAAAAHARIVVTVSIAVPLPSRTAAATVPAVSKYSTSTTSALRSWSPGWVAEATVTTTSSSTPGARRFQVEVVIAAVVLVLVMSKPFRSDAQGDQAASASPSGVGKAW